MLLFIAAALYIVVNLTFHLAAEACLSVALTHVGEAAWTHSALDGNLNHGKFWSMR